MNENLIVYSKKQQIIKFHFKLRTYVRQDSIKILSMYIELIFCPSSGLRLLFRLSLCYKLKKYRNMYILRADYIDDKNQSGGHT